MTQEEVFEKAWECTTVALYNLIYQSADEGLLSNDEIVRLTNEIEKIASWHDLQKERCRKEFQLE
jgi:hypothetical protein